MTEKVQNLSNEEAMSMIAGREGVEIKKSATAVSGFVPGKRTAAAASLDDVEERVAKLRKATGATEAAAVDSDAKEEEGDEDDDEIDIDDIDAEIEEAAAEGAAAAVKDVSTKSVPAAESKDVSTKSVPAGVFGGLAPPQIAKYTRAPQAAGTRSTLNSDKDYIATILGNTFSLLLVEPKGNESSNQNM
jgi:hypothetical protein